jgi:ABC-2 type transport system permease protein
LLSGAFFPATGAPAPLRWLMTINPLTYGMAALRRCLYPVQPAAAGPVPGLVPSLIISVAFCVVAFLTAAHSANRSGASAAILVLRATAC